MFNSKNESHLRACRGSVLCRVFYSALLSLAKYFTGVHY